MAKTKSKKTKQKVTSATIQRNFSPSEDKFNKIPASILKEVGTMVVVVCQRNEIYKQIEINSVYNKDMILKIDDLPYRIASIEKEMNKNKIVIEVKRNRGR